MNIEGAEADRLSDLDRLIVVIPTLNAAQGLRATLACLAPLPVLVADGGSTDGTDRVAAVRGARLIHAPRGRGSQLAAGIAATAQPWLLLLHADTRPDPAWRGAAGRFMADPANARRAAHFRFALDDDAPAARRLERMVAWRCRRLALPYGDQGLLIPRALLDDVGGMRPLPLMEDVDLIRRIGRRRLSALDVPFVTSAEKWRREGYLRRSAKNLLCLSLWSAGVPPRLIARLY